MKIFWSWQADLDRLDPDSPEVGRLQTVRFCAEVW